MSDLISRQAAIDELSQRYIIMDNPHYIGYNAGLDEAQKVIKALPPVQPKRGHWILDRSGAYCCSECMEPCATYVMTRPRDRFCKMCGADMRCSENPNS